MKSLFKVKNQFINQEITKGTYIDKIYKIHSNLFDYSDFICDTNISEIRIIDNKVILKFRDSGIEFFCTKDDKRLAPFDTLNFGDYESKELAMQLELIGPNSTIFDIGGNVGWYAMHIGKNRPNCTILCFEPIPGTFHYLNENIKLNKLDNTQTFNLGFSDREGSLTFYFDPTLSVNASLADLSTNGKTDSINCVVQKLDQFIKEHNTKVDFIKCDVEGAELYVFNGGQEVIQRDYPIIFTEMLRKWTAKFNYHPNDLISFFKKFGYSCFITRDNLLVRFDSVDESTIETNYFFLHNKKHKEQIIRFSTLHSNNME